MHHSDKHPLVSAIVPAYNAEATLAETLASVAAQRYPNIEIIIVNDGSTDRTRAIAAAFAREDPRATIVDRDNGGVAAARNAGIAASTGAYIAPIDADDVWHPGYLDKMLNKLTDAATLPTFAYAACRLIDAQSRVIGTGLNAGAEGPLVYRMLYCNVVGNGSAMVIPRSALLAAGGYDEQLHAAGCQGYEDYLLQLRLAARGPVGAVGEHLVGYRQRPQAMSRDVGRMLASARLARRFFAAEVAIDGPNWLRRWIRANGYLLAANAALVDRHYIEALGFLIRTVSLDPLAAITAVASRLEKGFDRKRKPIAPPKKFKDVDPAASEPGLGGRHIGGSLFVQLQKQRLARIAVIERYPEVLNVGTSGSAETDTSPELGVMRPVARDDPPNGSDVREKFL